MFEFDTNILSRSYISSTKSEEVLFEDDFTMDDFDTTEFDSNAEFELLDPWENQFFE